MILQCDLCYEWVFVKISSLVNWKLKNFKEKKSTYT